MTAHQLDKNMNKAFSTLFVVIILGSTSLALAAWISTNGFLSSRSSVDTKISEQTKALANSCAEVALQKMRDDNDFVGAGNVTLEGEICHYTVFDKGWEYHGKEDRREILVAATIKNITRKIKIKIDAFNPINVVSWVEIP